MLKLKFEKYHGLGNDFVIFDEKELEKNNIKKVVATSSKREKAEYMLKNASTKEERLYFINQYLEQIRTTVYRQVSFAEFEKETHAMVENGKALTADALEKLWKLATQFAGEW